MRWWIALLSVCCLTTVSSYASEDAPKRSSDAILVAMEQQLQADTTRYTLLAQRLNTIQKTQHINLAPNVLNKSFLKRMTTSLMMQEAEASNLELTVKAAHMEVELTQASIHNLQKRSLDTARHLPILPEIEETIRHQTKLLEIQQKRARVLQNTRDLLNKTVVLTKEWYKQLQIKSQSTLQSQREVALYSLADRLRHTQKAWIDQLEALSGQIEGEQNSAYITQMTDIVSMLQTTATEEKSNAMHIQLDLEMISNELQTVCDTLTHEPPLMVLNTLQKPLEGVFNHIQLLEDLLKRKRAFLKYSLKLASQEEHFNASAERDKKKRLILELEQCDTEYQQQAQQIEQLKTQAESAQKLFSRQLHGYLSSRQDLPGLNKSVWVNIIQKIKEIPALFKVRLLGVWRLAVSRIEQASWIYSGFAIVLSLLWMRVLVLFKRLTKAARRKLSNDSEKEQTSVLFSLGVRLFDRYIYSVILCLSIWSMLFIWKIPLTAVSWLFSLAAASLTFGIAIQICHFGLMESSDEEQGGDNRTLYYRLRSILSIGRLITLFSLVVHQLVFDYEVRNLVARLFMLFLFIIALMFFRIWALVPRLLESYWAKRPRYLKQVVRWLSFLLPMTLLLNAILGLIGYVQLAWAIVGYQSVLLLALCVYPLMRGLLNECFNWLSEQSIRHLRNGWLWSEALLKPLYQILKFFTFVSIIVLLFSFVGWREELRLWSTYPKMWFGKPFFTVFDVPIDTWKVIQVALMGAFIAWLARWTREFAYRSIFSNLKDLGLRNSLSVLMQYIAVFTATLTTLQLIGLTLSVLKYILSGFAIGLSFGLRDLLNNFVTGILLLVERPLKVGDWVTIGEYDGQVTYIGARSITINTEDRQELMVPNADLFYKHFINWTRHDSIVRITMPLFVSRKDDPVKVRELILEVVSTIPKILNNPASEVYFRANDQALLAFKIEYYVDLTQITSRSEVSSQFLFALWKRFKDENITPPKVAQEVHLTGEVGLNQLPLIEKPFVEAQKLEEQHV